MTEEFSYRNKMEVPKLQKIVISRGVGAAVADKKLVEHAIEELTLISGQKAVATLSKKDVSNFKLQGCQLVLVSHCVAIACMSF